MYTFYSSALDCTGYCHDHDGGADGQRADKICPDHISPPISNRTGQNQYTSSKLRYCSCAWHSWSTSKINLKQSIHH